MGGSHELPPNVQTSQPPPSRRPLRSVSRGSKVRSLMLGVLPGWALLLGLGALAWARRGELLVLWEALTSSAGGAGGGGGSGRRAK
ncbi:unnamed protein product [Prorocentrum cordatum]|uniref:Uncharacterized protein n=1 Tax=Prorocentrum cordatum TaxID=2364126 RepID=A0ABN9UAS4_9DINO|nr:unnamed protein product [Polarella glacialis]